MENVNQMLWSKIDYFKKILKNHYEDLKQVLEPNEKQTQK